MDLSVEYSEFVLPNSLALLLRRMGFTPMNSEQSNNPLLNRNDDDVMYYAATNHDLSLYVVDEVRSKNILYNPSDTLARAFLRRDASTLTALRDAAGERFESYYPVVPSGSDNTPMEVDKTEEDISIDVVDPSGWNYDVSDSDFVKRQYKPNVTQLRHRDDKDLSDGDYDIIAKCPEARRVVYVEGYSSRSRIIFNEVTVHSERLVIPLIKIHNGLGICLMHKVTDIIFLDGALNPVQTLDVYDQACDFLSALRRDGVSNVVDYPLLTTLGSIIDHDLETLYTDLRVGSRVMDGECSYEFESKSRGGIADVATLGYLVNNMVAPRHLLLCVGDRSALCMSLHTAEKFVTLVKGRVPEQRSVIYQCVEAFKQFLYRIGFPGELPRHETLEETYRLYTNIKMITYKLQETDGNIKVDMQPFTSALKSSHQSPANTVYTFNNWVEQDSGIKFYAFIY
ncbi:hypothetical protein RRG08_036667 [Elysia crispata]|uniref:Uncharacterized protein n=1 Tax=Elysia crispata TaxID=231223 RepID=A0AAE1AF99_9GAST|nr:hypothetical protein RRG08_036667 [Elysia crispata]